jgi:serine/threonine protein kinase/Flp pilus assembly protein TadD
MTPAMTPERYQQIGRLYQTALSLEPMQRSAFLLGACGEDEALRQAVEQLLLADERAQEENFIAEPAREVATELLAQERISMVGRSLNHYQIRSLLGAGGMGQVYLAQDTRLGRPVAIKLLPPHLTDDPQFVRRFRREAETVIALNHPNILTVYDFGEAEGIHYLVTEYVEGETLRQRLSQGKLSLAEILDVALQTTNALVAAHRAGFVHRDIKPENVMRRTDGIVKVLDFGLAKLTEVRTAERGARNQEAETLLPDLSDIPRSAFNDPTATMPGIVIGTAAYMSPEQARGQQVDALTDLFSLGAMLYEMCAGQLPFAGQDSAETLNHILSHEPAPLLDIAPETPVPLAQLIHRALCKDRAQRLPDAAALLLELNAIRRQFDNDHTVVSHTGIDKSAATTNEQRAAVKTASFLPAHFARPGWLAACVLVLIVVATLLWLNRRPGQLSDKDTILLADFENKTGEAIFNGTLNQGLTIQIGQSPFLSVFPEARLKESLRLMGRASDEAVTPAIAREICQRHGLKAFITGSIAALGNRYVLALQGVNAQTGEAIFNEQREIGAKEQVLQTLSETTVRLREKLGESLSSIQQFAAPIEQATTSSLEALKAFSLGHEQANRGNYGQSLPFYQRAIELDANFAVAWQALARQQLNTGHKQEAKFAATKAYELRDHASENEKLSITVSYYNIAQNDLEKAIQTAEVWKQTYPRYWRPYHTLADLYIEVAEFEKAAQNGREAVRLNPNVAAAYSNLAVALKDLGQLDEAKAVYAQAQANHLDAPEYHTFLYVIAAGQEDKAEMQRQIELLEAIPNGHYQALMSQSNVAAAEGKMRKALELTRQTVEFLRQERSPGELPVVFSWQAQVAAERGNCAAAKQFVRQELATQPAALRPESAMVLARCGETRLARLHAEKLAQLYQGDIRYSAYWVPMIYAHIEMARGNPDQAVVLLEPSRRYDNRWYNLIYTRGLAYLQLHKGAEAAAEFQKVIERNQHTRHVVTIRLAQLGLARAHAQTGDVSQARQAYEKFLAQWSEADADLPLLLAARQEYARLK